MSYSKKSDEKRELNIRVGAIFFVNTLNRWKNMSFLDILLRQAQTDGGWLKQMEHIIQSQCL